MLRALRLSLYGVFGTFGLATAILIAYGLILSGCSTPQSERVEVRENPSARLIRGPNATFPKNCYEMFDGDPPKHRLICEKR